MRVNGAIPSFVCRDNDENANKTTTTKMKTKQKVKNQIYISPLRRSQLSGDPERKCEPSNCGEKSTAKSN